MKPNTFESITSLIQSRSSSDAPPLGLITKLLQLNEIEDGLNLKERKTFVDILSVNADVALIYLIQIYTGARISEVLNLKSIDVDRRGGFILYGLKGSNDRYAIIPGTQKTLLHLKKIRHRIFEHVNYKIVYRAYKRVGIGMKFKHAVRQSVTHLPRHNYIKNLNSVAESHKTTKDVIGHKSIKSTEHYLKKNN